MRKQVMSVVLVLAMFSLSNQKPISAQAKALGYPLPDSSSHYWFARGQQRVSEFGFSVSDAGDVNGDGYDDVLVGAYSYDTIDAADEGKAYLYYSSAAGLDARPGWTAESNQADSWFGRSVSSAGDVNGDGYDDVIIGSPRYTNSEYHQGRAYLYYGSAAGLSPDSGWMAEGSQNDSEFGFSVSAAGDVNGDGYGDVIVGAYGYSNGETGEGRAYLYLGSPAGLSLDPAWTAESNQASAAFGSSVSGAGDVNGDGYDDVIVGALFYTNGQFDEGRAYLYYGSASGLQTNPGWTAEGNQATSRFSRSVSSAGDVNGDGYADVIVGADFYSDPEQYEGAAFLYYGSASGLSTDAGWTAEGNQESAGFGYSVSDAGDFNGDGYADVIVGAPSYGGKGRAYLYYGSANGLDTDPTRIFKTNESFAGLGISVSTAGDVNGDGFTDVLIGADEYVNSGPGFVMGWNGRGH